MAYKQDKSGEIIINGFENGIAESPYLGIADMKNVQLVSVPKEASVNFSTSAISQTSNNGTMTTSSAGADTVTLSGGSTLDTRVAIKFSVLSDDTKGIASNTVYWLSFVSAGVYNLYSDYNFASLVNITADSLTGTWASVNMGQPKYFNHFVTPYADCYFMVDANGLVWSNFFTTPNTGFLWTYTGNTTLTSAHGNGLISYIPSNSFDSSIGYVFVFRDFAIDYATVTSNTSLVWTYGWKPSTGATGQTNYLKTYGTSGGISASHEAFLAPDNVIYYCDGAYIGRWFEQTGKAFLPTDLTTYVADETRLLPFTDTAQCLSFLGTSLMIGGKNNVIYPWDTTSPTFSYPILLSEYNVQKLVTVNTNMFIFVGNRGRIYYTNGTNAQLYKKIPDHISGTIEPYFTWGGACSNKNQLYFSALVTTNAGTAITTYGGVWAIDLDSKAIRLSNTLSYQSTIYNGYASALIPNFSSTAGGTGLFIGWNNGSTTNGIDTTVSAPYSGGTAVAVAIIDSDLVPIGTTLKPTTNGRIEFKLAVPIVSGETVKLQYRQKFSSTFADIDANIIFNFAGIASGTWNGYSGVYQNVPFENSQWVQIRAILTSTASSPSYVRLTELRIGA